MCFFNSFRNVTPNTCSRLTAWSTPHCDKLVYGLKCWARHSLFITMFTRYYHQSLFYLILIYSTPSFLIPLRRMLLLWSIYDYISQEDVYLRGSWQECYTYISFLYFSSCNGSLNVFFVRYIHCKHIPRDMSSHYKPYGSGRLRLPRFTDSRHMKLARLSVLNTGCLYLQGWSLVVNSVRGWVEPGTLVRSEGLSQ